MYKTITNNHNKKVKICKNTFFPTSSIVKLMNIGDLIYPPGIVLPIITKRKIEGVILRPILDKTLGCDGILT